MEIRVGDQAAALLLALCMGCATGLLYDLLRPLRRRGGKPLAAALDGIFALAAAAAIFVFAMGADNGRLGVWELAAALLGFLLYMHSLSIWILPALEKVFQITGKMLERCGTFLKKVQNLLKKLFPKIRECFKMNK